MTESDHRREAAVTAIAFEIYSRMAVTDASGNEPDGAEWGLIEKLVEEYGDSVICGLWLIWARMINLGFDGHPHTTREIWRNGGPEPATGIANQAVTLAGNITLDSVGEIGTLFRTTANSGDWDSIVTVSCMLALAAARIYQSPAHTEEGGQP